MPVDKTKASLNSGLEVTTCKVVDVYLTDSKEAVEEKNGYKFEYPFTLKIQDSAGNIVSEEKSSSVMKAKNWNKKFYVSTNGEGDSYVNFTRHHVILALNMILKKLDNLEIEDVNSFIGYEFDAVLMGKDNPFINWSMTFANYDITVPEIEELSGVSKATSTPDKATTVEKPKPNEINPDDLPF